MAAKKKAPARKAKKKSANARDSKTGQRKTQLKTKRGAAVSGASKPGKARKAASKKRGGTTVGAGGASRKPRAAADPATQRAGAKQSAIGKRPPRPVSAAGRSAAKKK